MMKFTSVAAAVALTLASAAAVAAPEQELIIFGGSSTFPSNTHADDDREGTAVGEDVADALDLDPSDISADFNPGIGYNIRLGDSPFMATTGVRYSDHLDLSYQAGVRYNRSGSNFGVDLTAVRYDDSDVRDVFGHDVEGELKATYDVAKYLRLGAGITSATIDSDDDVSGLLTADLVFPFGGNTKSEPVINVKPVVRPMPKPAPRPVTPAPAPTGERG